MTDKRNEKGMALSGQAPSKVSSTTQTGEPTKRSLRVQTWKKIQEAKVGVGFHATFNRIPPFLNAERAVQLLSETDEFKRAQHIKINIDRALHDVKLCALNANKTLYLPTTRDSSAMFFKVDVPEGATEDEKRNTLRGPEILKMRTEIHIDTEPRIPLDMVVIGSVVVSEEGHRIGRGNGLTDLDMGVLIELGAVNEETIVATLVHDTQVVDSLPLQLFERFDMPVDLIVTPTRVIRVPDATPRPGGLYWELLSKSHLKLKPVLGKIKEMQEKLTGIPIDLKEEDFAIETFQVRRRRDALRRRYESKKHTDDVDCKPERNMNEERKSNEPNQNKRSSRRRGRYMRRRNRNEKQEATTDTKSEERKSEEGNGDRRRQRRRNRQIRDICVRLTNLSREIRVKDLKSELRKRKCNPVAITWKGQFGKCFLHFGNRNGTPSTQDDVDKVLESLSDLSLTINSGVSKSSSTEGEGEPKQEEQSKTFNLNVKLVKFGNMATSATSSDDNLNMDKPSSSTKIH